MSGVNLLTRLLKGIRAYHGSPHDFDRFDMSKIGTGEGAQAYGHGLYFAESEGVAKAYKEALAQRHNGITIPAVGGKKFLNDFTGPERQAYSMLVNDRGDIERSIVRAADAMNPDEVLGVLEKWKAQGGIVPPKGHMYEVNINADPARFLDWDKLPVQQAPHVRSDIDEIMRPLASEYTAHPDLGQRSMQSVIWDMGHPKMTGSHAKASEAMREAGIPGIRYLDQGSRAAADGSRNYVVFDDSIVDIVRKYGLGGLSMLPPAAAAYMSHKVKPVDYDPFGTPIEVDPFAPKDGA